MGHKFIFISFFLLFAARAFAVETTIKGGRMELVNKGESVVFSEGVQLDRGGDQLKAKKMKTNRDRSQIYAEGNVQLFRQVSATETWHAYGESGYYDTKAGGGYLTGPEKNKAHVIHTEIITSTSSRVVHLYAYRIDFFREVKNAFAKGAVHGSTVDPSTGEQYEFWSDEANFEGAKNTLTLTGSPQPVVIQTLATGKRTVKGDKIVYNTELKTMASEGNAEAIFEDEKTEKAKETPKTK